MSGTIQICIGLASSPHPLLGRVVEGKRHDGRRQPLLAVIEGPREARWEGGILFDDAVRDVLTLKTRSAREEADTLSDYGWYFSEAFPVFDSLIAAGIGHGDWDTAWQLTMINTQSLLLTGLVARLLHAFVGRDRPSAPDCRRDPEYGDICTSRAATSGFYSGHTALAFTGAGLTCAHHKNLPLWGGGAPDVVACALTLGTATATGVLRLMADKHYTTDIVASIAFGLFSGYVLPHWLHYASSPKSEGTSASGTRIGLLPWLTPSGLGVQAIGWN